MKTLTFDRVILDRLIDKSIRKTSVAVLISLLLGCEYLPDFPIATGFMAKNTCSGLWVSGYDEQYLVEKFITPFVPGLEATWKIDIDYDHQQVTVTGSMLKDSFKRTAVYRPPIGCVLTFDDELETLEAQAPIATPSPTADTSIPWPYGESDILTQSPEVDYQQLDSVYEHYFESAPAGLNTTSILVAWQGELIKERYEHGIDKYSPLKGFSMSKSVMALLATKLLQEGELNLDDPIMLNQPWDTSVTLNNTLHMNSGLAYKEIAVGDNNDQGELLYEHKSPISFAISKPQLYPPGQEYNYSSGDVVITAAAIQHQLGSLQDTYNYYQEHFFQPLNIYNAVIEHSNDDIMVGCAGVFLSARDWARLGQLILQQGEWQGESFFSQEWMDFLLAPVDSNESYGANIWLNTGQYLFPQLSEDAFAFVGAFDQWVVAIPSRQLLVVRTGFTHDHELFDMGALVADILTAFPTTDVTRQ